MPIVCQSSFANINDAIKKAVQRQVDDAVYRLHMIGVAAVKHARELKPDQGSFRDITGNLRSSIGYVVLVDGTERDTGGFEVISGSRGRGAKGASKGKAFLNKLKGKYSKGIVLIICAGMNYATYVEAKGKDVLISAELRAEELARKLFKK